MIQIYLSVWVTEVWLWNLYLIPCCFLSDAALLLCFLASMNEAVLPHHPLPPYFSQFGASWPWTKSPKL